MALYLAKKNASKTANQKGGSDKDDAAKKATGKPPLIGKSLKKSGAPIKEVIMQSISLILAGTGTSSISICEMEEVGCLRMDSST